MDLDKENVLLKQWEDKRKLLRADRLDMSFGEIISNYEEGVLTIDPAYQRVFRWKSEKQTRFIESILLGIPIPPIFVAEDNDGKWELIDGLQRISTILSFFGKLKESKNNNSKNNFKLDSGELLTELEGYTSESLPLKLQLTIKRFVCRVEILRWDTNQEIKYHLFDRLNTGGEPLTGQEVRNCIYRGKLNDMVNELAEGSDFYEVIAPTDNQQEQMFLSELVVRFLAFFVRFNDLKLPKSGNLQTYLSNFMAQQEFNDEMSKAKEAFIKTIQILKQYEDKGLDSLFRKNNKGVFSNNYYDTVMYLISRNLPKVTQDIKSSYEKIEEILVSEKYDYASGSRTHATKRMFEKIQVAESMFDE